MRLRIEQRSSNSVYGRDYAHEPVKLEPCIYCGHPTIEGISGGWAYGRHDASVRFGLCHACRMLLWRVRTRR